MHVITDSDRPITHAYDRYEDAARVVDALEAAGVPHRDISLASRGSGHAASPAVAGDEPDATLTAAGLGTTLGTVLGGGAVLGALAIPGAGPVVAGGWVLATLAGAGVGAAAGGLLGMLTEAETDTSDTRAYADPIKRGATLVTVRAQDAMAARIKPTMQSPSPA